ncbi:hypothetical protein LGQ02_11325 [Bacillus shivajii]|uniref:hypothetical protein n=1 Tax=Bacillus shivajii TaxID=1983719 RepID=UPI001CF98E3A|nr:hypothetical protein [Bacillus shivajii]UCZ51468.1 hypothetical protein LGQ02_11325 [Bacillus shivajii]
MKKIGLYVLLTFVGIVILSILSGLRNPMYQQLQMFDYQAFNVYHTYFVLCALSFGLLLGWRNIASLIKEGPKINLLLIPSVLMLIFIFIPYAYWTTHFGDLGVLSFVSSHDVRIALGIFTGLLLTRSFRKYLDDN